MKKYNAIVVGGGLAGVAAAVSAAREGLCVLIIEKEGSFGGAMSNSLVYPFMPYWSGSRSKGTFRLLSDGLFTQMRKRHAEMSGISDFELQPEYFKLMLDEMVCEAGIDVLFHAVVCDAKTENDKVHSIKVATKSGILDFEADFFIDTSGDGDLLALAGCDFQLGRQSDGLCQPMTTCFRMSGVDVELFKKDNKAIQQLYVKYKELGKIKNPREDIMTFYGIGDGIVHFNTTRIIELDPTNPFDISRAEIEARRQIVELVEFLQKESSAFRNSTIISIASNIGVRESRKLRGKYILTAEDLKNCVDFEDTIALGNYEIDIHNPSGSGTDHYFFGEDEYYRIPYRCLLPKEFNNLLVAGRCISATHEAQAAIRIMPICACLGEAAGTAVGMAHRSGKTTHDVDVKELRSKLISYGAAI